MSVDLCSRLAAHLSQAPSHPFCTAAALPPSQQQLQLQLDEQRRMGLPSRPATAVHGRPDLLQVLQRTLNTQARCMLDSASPPFSADLLAGVGYPEPLAKRRRLDAEQHHEQLVRLLSQHSDAFGQPGAGQYHKQPLQQPQQVRGYALAPPGVSPAGAVLSTSPSNLSEDSTFLGDTDTPESRMLAGEVLPGYLGAMPAAAAVQGYGLAGPATVGDLKRRFGSLSCTQTGTLMQQHQPTMGVPLLPQVVQQPLRRAAVLSNAAAAVAAAQQQQRRMVTVHTQQRQQHLQTLQLQLQTYCRQQSADAASVPLLQGPSTGEQPLQQQQHWQLHEQRQLQEHVSSIPNLATLVAAQQQQYATPPPAGLTLMRAMSGGLQAGMATMHSRVADASTLGAVPTAAAAWVPPAAPRVPVQYTQDASASVVLLSAPPQLRHQPPPQLLLQQHQQQLASAAAAPLTVPTPAPSTQLPTARLLQRVPSRSEVLSQVLPQWGEQRAVVWGRALSLQNVRTIQLTLHCWHRVLAKVAANPSALPLLPQYSSVEAALLGCLLVACKLEECRKGAPTSARFAALAGVPNAAMNAVEMAVLQLLDWAPMQGWRPGQTQASAEALQLGRAF